MTTDFMFSTTRSLPPSSPRSRPVRSAASFSISTAPGVARSKPAGSTLFLPVCDVSASLISLIAQFVDPALRRYAPASGGISIVDDRHGFRPAGTERWLSDGFLDADRILP